MIFLFIFGQKNNNRYRNDNFKGRQTLGCAIFNKQYVLCYWNE